MISFPYLWDKVGREVTSSDVGLAIKLCIQKLCVSNLSLSGGIDSTLLLYFMKEVLNTPIQCYTIALDKDHPDYLYASLVANFFDVELHSYFLYRSLEPDEIVKAFYTRLSEDNITKIIAGDGIDEFACGYYSHEQDQSEENYFSWLRRLEPEHLTPLNKNSGGVEVYLPYLSPDVVGLLSLIPITNKVSLGHRKKIITELSQGNIPEEVINRWKFGFCDASHRKDL
ncbi:MAG: asparagine synthase C-terminal domain-containing protein [Gammaproteobacteria bacterium]|nr:asparagine synthase C-terminal domain-containing protein [Gammaproteobacteria bacterium]